MLTEFMSEWYEEHVLWINSVIKVAAAESENNNVQIGKWIQKWRAEILQALQPLAQEALGGAAQVSLDAAVAQLSARTNKSGIN